MKQCNTGGAVRIVFNRCNRGRNIKLVPFEINYPVFLFMSTANVAHGHFSFVISSAATLLYGNERFFRNIRCDVAVVASYPESGSRGYRSEEHTSELQSLMRISYAGF